MSAIQRPLPQVVVTNLAWKTTAEQLRRHFERHHFVVSTVRLPRYDDGKSRGFAFVTLSFVSTNMESVLERMNNVPLMGRELRVEIPHGQLHAGV